MACASGHPIADMKDPPMAASTSRARDPRPAHEPVSGIRRALSTAALAGGMTGVALLGVSGALNPAQAAPKGNNGSVKIAQVGDVDNIPDNTPHVGCTFELQWYDFDLGNQTAQVSFTMQKPTLGTVQVSGGSTSPNVPGGPGLDTSVAYTLTPNATPSPTQGYHVKVVVTTPHSKGNDTKSKTFWFSGCNAAPPPPTTTAVPPPPTTTAVPPPATTTAVPPPPPPPTTTTAAPPPPTTTTAAPPPPTTTMAAPPPATTTAVPPPPGGATTATSSAAATTTATSVTPVVGTAVPPPPAGASTPKGPKGPKGSRPPASASPTPAPAVGTTTAVPTRIESGLATLPTADQSQQHGDSWRWLLLAVSGVTALLGAISLRPRRGARG